MTKKQKIFADEYLIDLNATRAYRAAYPSVKKDETARANGSRMLTNANIAKYISVLFRWKSWPVLNILSVWTHGMNPGKLKSIMLKDCRLSFFWTAKRST